MKTKLHVYNSHSGKSELFEPINAPFVGMYVCGPTVYNDVHIGNVRTFLSFDTIYRYLQHLGYKVRYVRNITDVGHLLGETAEGEDRISKQSRLEQRDPMEVVQQYTNYFHNVMKLFGAKEPSIEPTATAHLIEQIELTQHLLDQGLAYVSNGSVYFDVLKYNETHPYGELSGRKIDELIENTRDLDGQQDKKNSFDFALWKKADPSHLMQWNSPWSKGFPGWHLECTVMSTKYLGKQFDIHGGGMDLKFPHHECEIAQAKGAHGTDPVKYWLHANMLTLNGKKMSKSEGTFFTPVELVNGTTSVFSKAYGPGVLRFFMLQAHYRSTLDITEEALQSAETGYKRFMEGMKTMNSLAASANSSFDVDALIEDCYAAMNDDFHTPKLMAALSEVIRIVNLMAMGKETLTAADLTKLKNTVNALVFDVCGLLDDTAGGNSEIIDKLVNILIGMRNTAKANKDYATSDLIRNQLTEAGIQLKDSKEGTSYSLM